MTFRIDRSEKEEKRNHLRIDDTLISLITDYHEVSSAEAICFFNDLATQMTKTDGNVVNKNMAKRRMGVNKQGVWRWITSGGVKYDYNAYAFRGFYPGTKIPFKMSGFVNVCATACWVITIGNKNKNTCLQSHDLKKLEEIVSEAILLDDCDLDQVEKIYKNKTFRCMRPKSMPLLKKAKKCQKMN